MSLRSNTPPAVPGSQVALAGGFARPRPSDSVQEALAAAQHAYATGDLLSAKSWIDVASQRLDVRLPRQATRERWDLGNASQLLEYLDDYGYYAYGQQPLLDVQYEWLAAELATIEQLNNEPSRPSRLGEEWVSYDLITHLVDGIGDLRISYDLITRQINGVGDLRISYDLITHQPTRIGDIEYHYDLIDRTVDRVAGIDVD